ncbi:hypothetical protein BB561_001006 [Smittium simulii]|uniref:PCI domain-containing protein n=1 Tax=Smittium simulii TaxID=133385 RepID=A0A2T9YWR5_9FUNG|nr:hypothetical protein BB561_001006 [Smittium simulii]
MAPIYKPEIALKRAGELIAVGQHSTALQTLYEAFLSRKPRGFVYDSHQDFINKFVELSVEQRKGSILKEGLQNYRNSSQHADIEPFEETIRLVFKITEEKVQNAQKQADQLSLDSIEDLEETETPESILLSVVSTEQTKDRTDRAIVTPWLKFLWEAYRNILDILRKNSKFLKIYQEVSKKAISFCLAYQRKNEFKRLCDLLRNHLLIITKSYPQNQYIDIKEPGVFRMYLDTRFMLLNAASDLDLWPEAFRITEDINILFAQSRSSVNSYFVAVYYEKLTRILSQSSNQLFLAAAWHCYFNLIKGQAKSVGEAEIQRAANNTLLSTLAVPIIRSSSRIMHAKDYENKNRTQKLTNLLMLNTPPTRSSLITNLSTLDIFSFVRPELCPIYELLEDKFHPLSICKKLTPILRDNLSANSEEARYIPLLCNVTLTRLIQQLSQIYSTVRMETLFKLAEFEDPFKMSSIDIERFIVNGARRGEFQLRLDHQLRVILFDIDPFDSARPEDSGAQLQNSPAELMRLQLTNIAFSLSNIQRVIAPETNVKAIEDLNESVVVAQKSMNDDRQVTTNCREYIESKKKIIEPLIEEKAKQEAAVEMLNKKKEQERRAALIAEQKAKQLQERLAKEREEAQREDNKRIVESLKARSGLSILPDDLENLDTDKLLQLQVEQIEKEKQEIRNRHKDASRQMDHLIRAYRKEEIPLLYKDSENQQATDLQNHDDTYKSVIETAQFKHKFDLSVKKRLNKILGDYFITKDSLNKKNAQKVAELQAETQAQLEKAKTRRIELYRKLTAEKLELKAAEERKRIEDEEKAKAEREKQERILAEKAILAEEARKKAELEKAQTSSAYVPPAMRASIAKPPTSYAQTTKSVEPPTEHIPVASPGAYVPPSRTKTIIPTNTSVANTKPLGSSETYNKYVPRHLRQNEFAESPRASPISPSTPTTFKAFSSGSDSFAKPRTPSFSTSSTQPSTKYVPPYKKNTDFTPVEGRQSTTSYSHGSIRSKNPMDFKSRESFPSLGIDNQSASDVQSTTYEPLVKSNNSFEALENFQEPTTANKPAVWGFKSTK